jgi:hypothetical protein
MATLANSAAVLIKSLVLIRKFLSVDWSRPRTSIKRQSNVVVPLACKEWYRRDED